MAGTFDFRPVPVGFSKRFPDGDYTVGRGADPRGRLSQSNIDATVAAAPEKKRRKPRRRTEKPARSAAE